MKDEKKQRRTGFNSSFYILDASAVLAYLQDEPGADYVAKHLDHAVISAVNLVEVVNTLTRNQIPIADFVRIIKSGVIPVHAFDQEQALITSEWTEKLMGRNIALGDRACLALAKARNAIALTADRAWMELGLDVKIELIR